MLGFVVFLCPGTRKNWSFKSIKIKSQDQRTQKGTKSIKEKAVTVSSSLQKLLQFNHHCKSCYSLIIIAKAVTLSYSLLVMRLNSLVSSLSLYIARILECLGPSWIIANYSKRTFARRRNPSRQRRSEHLPLEVKNQALGTRIEGLYVFLFIILL